MITPEEQLASEGFEHIYTWHDKQGKVYKMHSHKDKVAVIVLRGSVKFSGGIEKQVSAGERFDVPAGVKHSAIVGPDGCDYFVGEMIEGDA